MPRINVPSDKTPVPPTQSTATATPIADPSEAAAAVDGFKDAMAQWAFDLLQQWVIDYVWKMMVWAGQYPLTVAANIDEWLASAAGRLVFWPRMKYATNTENGGYEYGMLLTSWFIILCTLMLLGYSARRVWTILQCKRKIA